MYFLLVFLLVPYQCRFLWLVTICLHSLVINAVPPYLTTSTCHRSTCENVFLVDNHSRLSQTSASLEIDCHAFCRCIQAADGASSHCVYDCFLQLGSCSCVLYLRLYYDHATSLPVVDKVLQSSSPHYLRDIITIQPS